jgi:histidinol-phosphate aminotransferase
MKRIQDAGNVDRTEAALRLVRRTVRDMTGYVPGLQPAPGRKLVKLNTNENPFPPSPRVLAALREAVDASLRLYPSPDGKGLREAAAETYGLHPDQVLCANGSDEALAIVMRTFLDQGDAVAWFRPSYSLYPVLSEITGARGEEIPIGRPSRREDVPEIPVPRPKARVFFLTTPNAPYGFQFPTAWIRRFLDSYGGIVAADEAYVDFAPESSLPLLAEHPNLLVVRTLSKSYSLAGMRAGLVFGHPGLIAEMAKVKDSYNMSRLAQVAAREALLDADYFRMSRDKVLAVRQSFSQRLARLGFTVLPSDANFVFAVPPAGATAASLYQELLDRGFLVRYFGVPEISDGLRISIGTEEDMDGLAAAVEEMTHGG